MELDSSSSGSCPIAYDIVESHLGSSSPTPALSVPDSIAEQIPSSHDTLVLRRVIDDYRSDDEGGTAAAAAAAAASASEKEEEVQESEIEYLSLSISGDDEDLMEQEKDRIDESIFSSPLLPAPNGSVGLENPPWYQLGLERPISMRSPLLELHQGYTSLTFFK
jgi:hypothetical protein